MSIPDFERLQADIGKTYQLTFDDGSSLPVEVTAARGGIPMNPRYCCYSAYMALPDAVQLGQTQCTVSSSNDVWPGLLLTPVGPGEDGRQRMQMVFHVLISQARPAHAPADA